MLGSRIQRIGQFQISGLFPLKVRVRAAGWGGKTELLGLFDYTYCLLTFDTIYYLFPKRADLTTSA